MTSSGGERDDHLMPGHDKTGSEGWPLEAGPNARSKSDTAEIARSREIVEMARSSKSSNNRLPHDAARHYDRRSHDRLSDHTDGTPYPTPRMPNPPWDRPPPRCALTVPGRASARISTPTLNRL